MSNKKSLPKQVKRKNEDKKGTIKSYRQDNKNGS